MKLSTITIAIALAGFCGMASAAGQDNTMQPVVVSGAAISGCVPPDDQAGHACDAFDQWVRANFTEREIGMLFGDRTSYPEYLTGGIDRLQQRYQKLLSEYVAQHSQAARAPAVAAK